MPIKFIPLILCLFLFLVVLSDTRAEDFSSTKPATGDVVGVGENNWLTQSQINVPTPGMVESVLIPELHRAAAAKEGAADNQLDICLYGPDNNPRSFELFWREKGQQETVLLERTNVWLVEDRLLLWDGIVPENFMVNKIIIDIADSNYMGQVDVAAMNDSDWFFLVKDAALYKNDRTKQADIAIKEGLYKRFRLGFKGYDKKYGETPLFVNRVQAVGVRSGRDYETTSFQPEFEETTEDQTTDVRMSLPGAGIWISDIKIVTEALFQGRWQLGRESIVLGKREFSLIKEGSISHVGQNQQTLLINVDQCWPDQALMVRMTAGDFFGRIKAVDVQARIPRLVFFADLAGQYNIRSGCGNRIPILETTGDRERKIDHHLPLSGISLTPRSWQADQIEKCNINGGPFNNEGYAWEADAQIGEPGFYQLQLNERACLEENIAGLRLVKNGSQVPYFFGPEEEMPLHLETSTEYDAENNRTVCIMRLPFSSPQWSAIQLKADGLFERTLVFEKHASGMVGWQPWESRRWASQADQEASFRMELTDFPKDQDEIRLVINHGDNQPLNIKEISVLYKARDVFFLASEAGIYKLVGGNPNAPEGSYKDFEMIKNDLMSASPRQVVMGPIKTLLIGKEKPLAGKDLGGPFDGSGFSWTVKIEGITKPGLCQLSLNQQASLEANRKGLRIVRNNQQVPYFMGRILQRQIEITPDKQYDRKKNETVWLISLPQSSVHWQALQLMAEGFFDRDVIFEIRKPGNSGWQQWRRETWTNRKEGGTLLESPLVGFPQDQTDIRLVMTHGDNQPLEIKKIQAVYTTQDLFFIAGDTSGYELYGGNPKALAPSYDLALIQDHILAREPIKITMGKIETFKPAEWKTKLSLWFSEQGWGLYFVFGLVTLILLVIIVKLFPKEGEKEEDHNN